MPVPTSEVSVPAAPALVGADDGETAPAFD